MIEPGGAVTGGVADLAMPWSWQVGEVEVNETTTQHAAQQTKSGKNLSRGQHYFLASVATERYGNERGVNVLISNHGMLSGGISQFLILNI